MTEPTDDGVRREPRSHDPPSPRPEWRAPALTLLGDADALTAGPATKSNPGTDGSSMS